MKKRDVAMVTVSARSLKLAFRKAFPEQGAQDLHPRWLRFWASIVLSAKVEMVTPERDEPDVLDNLAKAVEAGTVKTEVVG